MNGFDSLNRQWKRESPDGSAQYYLYTADDERLMTTFSSGGVSFRWTLRDFGGKVLRVYENAVTGANAIAVRDYIHAGERILGTEDPRDPANTRMLATVDHLGTPRLWTDSNGNALRKHKYFPFGKEATPSDQWPIALQFTGHERDPNDLSMADEDSDYMHARFGGSAFGRLMSVDPVPGRSSAPQSFNLFSYVRNNPMNGVDPLGLYLIRLGQNSDEEIAAKLKRLKERLKEKGLTREEKGELRSQRDRLTWERRGNQAVGAMIEALGKTGNTNGLTLGAFTLSTDTANDFPGAPTEAIREMSGKAAFVLQSPASLTGTIYVRTEPAGGFFQQSQLGRDHVFYGASAIRHEQVHLFGNSSEYDAYTLQRSVFQSFAPYFSDRALFNSYGTFIDEEIGNHAPSN